MNHFDLTNFLAWENQFENVDIDRHKHRRHRDFQTPPPNIILRMQLAVVFPNFSRLSSRLRQTFLDFKNKLNLLIIIEFT